MQTSTTHVLIIHNRPTTYVATLRAQFPQLRFETCHDPESYAALDPTFRPVVIMAFHLTEMPNALSREIALGEQVKWVQVGGAGFDFIMPRPQDAGFVTNCSGVLSEFLAETMIGMLLAMNFRILEFIQQQRERRWHQITWTSVQGKTVLIVGLGNVGRAVARRCKQFGMHVIGLRRSRTATPEVDEQINFDGLYDALARADFVCLHTPLTPETHHLIGAEALKTMQPHAILLNAARGAVVDEAALIAALQQGDIAAAYLDVLETEPLPASSPLWEMPNVIITPHVADWVEDWEQRFYDFFAANLARWLASEPLLNVVDVARGY
ncbi:MAG: D-2-hydroxyacid dehydrogenase [Candidatus Promineifilaceae bacterium]